MSKNPMISLVESKHLKKSIPILKPGDVVRVHQRIVEAGKERIQVFEGLVISVAGSRGIDGSFTVRRIASGVGVERVYPLHSPKIAKIERVKSSKVRQAKLYYIRELTGRKARLRADSYEAESWEEAQAKEEPVAKIEQEDVEAPKDQDFETVEETEAEVQDSEEAEAEEQANEEVETAEDVEETEEEPEEKV